MKRLFLVLASMASIASAFAQDVIVKRDGEEIQCKILEVSTNKVKYKQWKNQSGPTFVEKKADVLMLKYENGQKEVVSYSAPVSASQIEETVAVAPVDSAALADTMPISNDYLEYVRKEKSGLLMWGRSISEEKAHEIMGKDWTDFTRAHRSERIGRAMIITGGALIVGGGLWTAQYAWASKDYNNKKSAYEDHVASAEAGFTDKVKRLENDYNVAEVKKSEAKSVFDGLSTQFVNASNAYNEANDAYENGTGTRNERDYALNEMNQVKKELDAATEALSDADAVATEAYNAYKSYYIDNGDANYNAEFYNSSFKADMDKAKDYKKSTLYPMIGCYASGAALLVWGIIKEKRAHKKINQIVNKYNVEDVAPEEIPAEIPAETSFKPEFDMESRGNGLALLMKF